MFIKYILTSLFILMASSSYAQLVIVINKENSNTLSKKDVSRIFLGKEKKFADGSETIPINQANGSSARDTFNQEVLGRSSSQVAAYWSRLVFTGKGIPPKEVDSSADVITLVEKNKSAIGYVDKADVTDTVKIVNF